MKKLLQILLIASLIALGVIQILFAKGILGKDELLEVCPVDAIAMENGKAQINQDKCIGCRRCVIGVPRKSTPVVEEVTENLPDELPGVEPITPPTPVTTPKETVKETKKTTAESVQTVLKYIVDADKCIGCTLCVSNCPSQAITMVKGKAVIDTDKCISCDVCVSGNKTDFGGCPVQAISRK